MTSPTRSEADPAATEIHTLGTDRLAGWSGRRLERPARDELPRLNEVFREILWTANEYIPSDAGSICLGGLPQADDELVYVAAFGKRAHAITGERLPITEGITGRVFREGTVAMINDPRSDPHFFAGMDEKSDYHTRSILAAPIRLDKDPVGVISLVNRLGMDGFREADRRLLGVLCGYASNSLLNLADAAYHREIARRDNLTGLRNDRFFHQQLRVELEARERSGADLSLLFLDLDRFKRVVDTHGHLIGSQVLAEVGQLIARVVTQPDATLARYGGDEYVVILPGADAAAGVATAESIRQAIADTVFLSEPGADGRPALNLKREFSASIGVASYRDCSFATHPPADWKTRQRDFIQIADEAMYRAKREGKDRVCAGR
ncbi:diguanylate cyclase [Haloferula sp. A504]|uniref:diguanylate cyclase n=1 Tax=Haloferula sp. A504 TaxID=3373601 RepID=UPI0031C0E28C|nr:sensor domain-containing diguanylate cyclase [Verrucomicrobiaceae bacterium E54]